MEKIRLGGLTSVIPKKRIPITGDDCISGKRRDISKRKMYIFRFEYEIQIPTGESSFKTEIGEKEITIKCPVNTDLTIIRESAKRKLLDTFLSNDRIIDYKELHCRRLF